MMATLRVTAFANTFLVSNNGHGGPALKIVGPQEIRKKRPHRKSRLGCVRCKRRKVKCDEGDPCRHCVKRGEACVRLSPRSSNRGEGASPPLPSPPPEVAWCPLSEPECGSINLLHMELLHHFERYSIPTLPFETLWPRMLQMAFQSRQHTYLLNAVLSYAAAHLDYLHAGNHQHAPRYHRAKYALLNKSLHDYRETLSAPITPNNCDALFGTANLIQFLMWSDLSFMEGQLTTRSVTGPETLDLSGDRLYFLSTGVRQVFFMAWPLFQLEGSVFRNVALLQPCMVLEDIVDALALDWQRYLRGFMEVYDDVRYQGQRGSPGGSASVRVSDQSSGGLASPASSGLGSGASSSFPSTPSTAGSGANGSSAAYLEGLLPNLPSTSAPPYRVMTLWQSFKEGEAYVKSAGAVDEALVRAAFKRLVSRLAVAMAFLKDRDQCDGCGSLAFGTKGEVLRSCRQHEVKRGDMVRYVAVFPMMCFGPLLALISSGDSRMLVVLYHIYRVAGALLPEERYWWCRKRIQVMEEAIGGELRSRGLEVCSRRRSEFM